MSNVNELTPPERAQIYRIRARELVRKAQEAPSEQLRTTYLNLAASWQELAATVERQPEPDSGMN